VYAGAPDDAELVGMPEEGLIPSPPKVLGGVSKLPTLARLPGV
jgi:hypothetical protein